MGVCFSLGVTAAAAVQPEVVTSRDAHDIHHPAEKNCPVCGMSNYIEEMHASVECFKCRREGKHTVVTRDGAPGSRARTASQPRQLMSTSLNATCKRSRQKRSTQLSMLA